MLRTLLFALALFLPVCMAQAQLLGDYSVGSGGDYATLAAAVADLNSVGTDGEVIFTIKPGTYDEQVTITDFTRSGMPDDLVVFLNDGVLGDVVWQYSSAGAATNWVVNLDGADHVLFLNISFQAAEPTGQYGRLIQLLGGATHITVEDCVFIGLDTLPSGAFDRASIIYEADNSQNDHLLLNGNAFVGGSIAVDLDFGGGGTSSSDFQRIINNDFVGQYFRAVGSRGKDTEVMNNTVRTSLFSHASVYIALDIEAAGSIIAGNEITMGKGSDGIRLSNSGDSSTRDDIVYNNMISLYGGSAFEYGMDIGKPDAKILHNTVRAAGDASTVSVRLSSVAPCCPMTFSNNLLVNEAGGSALRVTNLASITGNDWNNLYSTDPSKAVEFDGTGTQMSLADWRSTSGLDQNSVEVPVTFFDVIGSTHDLHLSGASDGDTQLGAPPYPDVPTDIDGTLRSSHYTYMGADEAATQIGVEYAVTVFLDGPYEFGTADMRTDLNSMDLLENLAQSNPYANCGPSATVPLDFFTNHPDIVDWVCIELRTGNPHSPPMVVVDQQPAFVKNTGQVVSYTDGASDPAFKAVPESYYVVARHRNHLAAMSATIRAAGDGTGTANFNVISVFGTNPMRDVGGGNKALWGGDGTGDGGVTAFDFLNTWLPINGGPPGYYGGDFDMNGSGTAFDFLTTWLPANGQATQVP